MTNPLASLIRGLAIGAMLLACNKPDVVEHTGEVTEDEDEAELTKLAFDPDTVETMKGTVVAVDPFQTMKGTRYGLRARVEVDGETLYVYLGPQRYLDSHTFTLKSGEEVEVIGSVLPGDGRRVVIANKITKGMTTLELRDEEGRPLWRRWRAWKQS
jgi:hypothetical protein